MFHSPASRFFSKKLINFAAGQNEKAMAELYNYFLGYSTDNEILENNKDYYAASREINHFKTWGNLRSFIKLQEDGTLALVISKQVKPIVGLIK